MPFDASPTQAETPAEIETPAQIAKAKARMSARHQADHVRQTTLRARRDANGQEMRDLQNDRHDLHKGSAVADRLRQLDIERVEIETALVPLRRAVREHRVEHSRRAYLALHPTIVASSARGFEAVQALAEALGVLAECDKVLTAAGHEGVPVFGPELGSLLARLARLSGRS